MASASEAVKHLSVTDTLDLLATTRGMLQSDVPRTSLRALVDLVRDVKRDRIVSISLVPSDFISERDNGYPLPDVDAMRRNLSSESPAELAVRKAAKEC